MQGSSLHFPFIPEVGVNVDTRQQLADRYGTISILTTQSDRRTLCRDIVQHIVSMLHHIHIHIHKKQTKKLKTIFAISMQLITFCIGLILAAQAQAAASSSYSSIFTAAVASSSMTIANAVSNWQYHDINTGFCTGGTASCGIFSTNNCPWPYCTLGSTYYSEDETCVPATNADRSIPCSVLTEDQCNAAHTDYGADCKYLNQGKTNSVLIALTSISLIMLLAIMIVVWRRLPVPKKDTGSETPHTQPLLDEENS